MHTGRLSAPPDLRTQQYTPSYRDVRTSGAGEGRGASYTAVISGTGFSQQELRAAISYENPMRALTILPLQPATARLDEVPDPPLQDGPLLVRTLAIGVCGTDR